MRRVVIPLLCELHAHTTWSDGALSVAELVDLYGRSGFDVLCITDHTLRNAAEPTVGHVDRGQHAAYLAEVRAEAARAAALYDLLVLPGLELTYDDPDPRLAAHAVAVGLESFVALEDGLEAALADARDAGAALIAAHPYAIDAVSSSLRGTGRWHADRDLAALVDRFELINRHDVFAWVAEARLPVVASGDFHRLEHLATWKTLLPCAKEAESVVGYLRSRRAASLVQLTTVEREQIAA
jgi:predicted metal-dependent phosphoesterase TrpH